MRMINFAHFNICVWLRMDKVYRMLSKNTMHKFVFWQCNRPNFWHSFNNIEQITINYASVKFRRIPQNLYKYGLQWYTF